MALTVGTWAWRSRRSSSTSPSSRLRFRSRRACCRTARGRALARAPAAGVAGARHRARDLRHRAAASAPTPSSSSSPSASPGRCWPAPRSGGSGSRRRAPLVFAPDRPRRTARARGDLASRPRLHTPRGCARSSARPRTRARARSSPASPSRRGAVAIREQCVRAPSASALVVAGLDEQSRLAVGDDLRHGAHPRRDDRQAGEHRLEQNDPEPLPARGVDEDVRALEPVADVRAARQGTRRRRARARRRAARVSASSGPLPRIASRASGTAERTRANARSSVAWSFCAISRPTASSERRVRRDPRGLGVSSDARGRQLVEPVTNRHQLRRVVSCALEEVAALRPRSRSAVARAAAKARST